MNNYIGTTITVCLSYGLNCLRFFWLHHKVTIGDQWLMFLPIVSKITILHNTDALA